MLLSAISWNNTANIRLIPFRWMILAFSAIVVKIKFVSETYCEEGELKVAKDSFKLRWARWILSRLICQKNHFPCRWKFDWNSIKLRWSKKGLNQRKQEAHRTPWQQTHLRKHLRSINFIKSEFSSFLFLPFFSSEFFKHFGFFVDQEFIAKSPTFVLVFYFHTSNISTFSFLFPFANPK